MVIGYCFPRTPHFGQPVIYMYEAANEWNVMGKTKGRGYYIININKYFQYLHNSRQNTHETPFYCCLNCKGRGQGDEAWYYLSIRLDASCKTFIHRDYTLSTNSFVFETYFSFATIVNSHNSAAIYLETLLIFIIDDLCESRLLLSELSYNCRIPPCWNYSTTLKTNVNSTTYFNIHIN